MVAEAPKPLGSRLRMMVDNMVLEMRELGAVLILGSAIAAFVQVAIPREVVLSLGQGPVTSIMAMMALAWVVSICSTVDSFFCPFLRLNLHQRGSPGFSGVWADDRPEKHQPAADGV